MLDRYVVCCSHLRSLHASAFLQAAAERGFPPAGVLSVRLWSPDRARATLRARGWPDAARRITRLFAPGAAAPVAGGDEEVPLRAWMSRGGLDPRADVGAVCRRLRIRPWLCGSLNDSRTIRHLRDRRYDFAVYLGGGILRPEFIAAAGGTVFNVHQGPLPAIRGMNACEWTVYTGGTPAVSVHLIDSGIDTGPICEVREISLRPGLSIAELRGETVTTGLGLLLECMERRRAGRLELRAQRPADGRQYFQMHPFLLEIASRRLARRCAGASPPP